MIAILIGLSLMVCGAIVGNNTLIFFGCFFVLFLTMACVISEISKARKALENISQYYEDKFRRGE